ncbi:alkaline phosphatase D family protein [Congregibacter litoralis]|uniref:Phosphodiesterase/alkaline phosphatase D n=1 Tax=Congregibacter litoralis KT71 TaxID=314285 RepID=A4A6Z3_9GAMM|nr:alkaline phosphatase D family protein [Congregibacter litoralis]EAQ98062.1 Phosphodiesterase/alkaline phosphatase D [Congregibacter litoralis KT71]
MKLTRRNALRSATGALLLPLGGSIQAQPDSRSSSVFGHGVASGDPDEQSFVIWTRISRLAAEGSVDWEVATDSAFRTVVSSGRSVASPRRDYTVKVLVAGLRPGMRYYYRFHHGSEASAIGRARTLPLGELSSLTLAVASCSNYPFGHFNAYDAIAEDEQIDWVLHLGDYIYEYGVDGYGAASGAAIGREHEPRHEIVTLGDYRERHAQYKSDPQSQRMHAAHSLLAIWDDHEVTNNPWTDGAENHQPEEEGPWAARREAALRAYFEWMPVRDPAPGHSLADYWRHWRFGSLASLITLETRHSGRAEQIEYADYRATLTDADSVEGFLRDVVGAPDRPMLSPAMENFLRDALTESAELGRPWKLLGNQIPMARTHHPRFSADVLAELQDMVEGDSAARLEAFVGAGNLGLPLYLDPWDGYPVARQKLYSLSAECGVRDLLVLTGDSHSFWSNRLFDDAGKSMGIELGTTGITSPGDFKAFGSRASELVDEALAATNDEIAWTDGRHNGYLRLSLTPDAATAEFLAVDQVTRPSYAMETLRTERISHEAGDLVSL